MSSTYKIIESKELSPQYIERTDEDGRVFCIPEDPENSDYQTYLAQLPVEKPKK